MPHCAVRVLHSAALAKNAIEGKHRPVSPFMQSAKAINNSFSVALCGLCLIAQAAAWKLIF